MSKQENTQVEVVETGEKVQLFTPYQAAKVVNVHLEGQGLKAIPPQMMYNYTTARVNAGKAPAIKLTETGEVDREDLDRWIEAYVNKKLTAAAPAEELVEAN